jgi:hypothetical protein
MDGAAIVYLRFARQAYSPHQQHLSWQNRWFDLTARP